MFVSEICFFVCVKRSQELSADNSKNFLLELSNLIDKIPPIADYDESKDEINKDELKLSNLEESDKAKSKAKSLSFRQNTTTKSKSKSYTFDASKSYNYDESSEQHQNGKPKYNIFSFDSSSQREPTKTRSKMIESESKKIENAILKAPIACQSILKVN